jgi:hypothetical protein
MIAIAIFQQLWRPANEFRLRSPGAKVSNEGLLVHMNTVHWNGCRKSEHSVIQGCTVLPFRKKTLSVQRSKLSVAQPHSGQIRVGTASAGH